MHGYVRFAPKVAKQRGDFNNTIFGLPGICQRKIRGMPIHSVIVLYDIAWPNMSALINEKLITIPYITIELVIGDISVQYLFCLKVLPFIFHALWQAFKQTA